MSTESTQTEKRGALGDARGQQAPRSIAARYVQPEERLRACRRAWDGPIAPASLPSCSRGRVMSVSVGVCGGPELVTKLASIHPSVVLLASDIDPAHVDSRNMAAVVVEVGPDSERRAIGIADAFRERLVGVVVVLTATHPTPGALRRHLVVVRDESGSVDPQNLVPAVQAAWAITAISAKASSKLWASANDEDAATQYAVSPARNGSTVVDNETGAQRSPSFDDAAPTVTVSDAMILRADEITVSDFLPVQPSDEHNIGAVADSAEGKEPSAASVTWLPMGSGVTGVSSLFARLGPVAQPYPARQSAALRLPPPRVRASARRTNNMTAPGPARRRVGVWWIWGVTATSVVAGASALLWRCG